MNFLKDSWYLFQKDLKLELRQQYAINGLLLYVGGTVFLVYTTFREIDSTTWLGIFWIILLFSAANTVAKSFTQDSTSRQLYYYTLVGPEKVVFTKIFFNFFLLLLISILALAVYSLLLGYPVLDTGLFLLVLVLGCANFAAVFSMSGAIAFKAGGNSTLVPILSFPILIPVIMLLISASKAAMTEITSVNLYKDLGMLAALFVLTLTLSLILYPFLWKD